MGRKKADDLSSDVISNLSSSGLSIIEKIEKLIGKNIIVGGDLIQKEHRQIIPLGPALDVGLCGGIPEGSWVVISGPPKYGKTTTMMSFAANCQKPEFGNRNVYYGSIEGRFGPQNLQIDGLITESPRFNLIRSTKDHILTAEEFLQIFEIAIRDDPGCLVIIDSYSALCTASETSKDFSANLRSDAPKLLMNFCRKMSQLVPLNKCIVMGVTKRIANTSGFGSPWSEAGGNGIQFQESVKISLKKREYVVDPDGSTIGQKVLWKIEDSALGPPNGEVESIIKYGKGIYKAAEIGMLALSMNLAEKNGAWYYIGDQKWQGEVNFFRAIEEDEALQAKLYKDILEMVK